MSDTVPESTPAASTGSIWKILFWSAVAVLIGVFLFYSWHEEVLEEGLSDKDTKLAEMTQRLASLQTDLGAAKETEAGLRSEVAGFESAAAAEMDALKSELQERIDFFRTALEGGEPERAAQIAKIEEEAKAAYATLEQSLKAREADLNARLDEAVRETQNLKAAHQAQGSELQEAKEALARREADLKQTQGELEDLKGRHDQRVTELETQLEEGKQALAATKTDHEAAVAAAAEELQRHEDAIKEAKAQGEQALAAAKAEHEATAAAASEERQHHENAIEKTKVQGEQALAAAKAEYEAAATAAAEERQRREAEIQETKVQLAALEETLNKARAEALQALENQRRDAEAALKALAEADAKMLAEVRELYTDFAELEARPTDRGMLLKVAEGDLRFPHGSAVLPRGKLPILDRIAVLLNEHPQLSAFVEGHTDKTGPDDINLAVSKARAEAVRKALIERGVPEARLSSAGVGGTRPIADNASAAGRSQNRRVDVFVVERVD